MSQAPKLLLMKSPVLLHIYDNKSVSETIGQIKITLETD